MRNVVPRQGTETKNVKSAVNAIQIEKCSSPTGDGNKVICTIQESKYNIEKCSSPTGDGNRFFCIFVRLLMLIEKCSSPTGDGNCGTYFRVLF